MASPLPPLPDAGATPARAEFGTELWLAQSLVAKHGHDLRYVGPWKKWLVYDVELGAWGRDETGELQRRAETVVREVQLGAARLAAQATTKDEAERAAAWLAVAKKFMARRPMISSIALAQAHQRVAITHEALDRDPWALNVANGTIDLRTGEMRPHRRDDLLTRVCPVAYDPDAEAPTWEGFLERVQPDPDVRSYLQRAAGYTATGLVWDHVLHIMLGVGSNGKNTFCDTIAHVLGNYASPIPSTLLMAGRNDRHPTELALLSGLRLALADETPEGGKLNEHIVKWITGGGRILARRMHEDFWGFDPTHKLWIMTNHRPRITGADHGIWRRLRVVPWTQVIPEKERELDLGERLRTKEAAGILRWIVQGARLYQQQGLGPPDAICEAGEEYRSSEDDLGEWITECCVTGDGFVSTLSLYESYQAFCQQHSIPDKSRIGRRTLTNKLRERGYSYVTKPIRGFRGLAVYEPEPVHTREDYLS